MPTSSKWDFVSTNGGREDGIHNAMVEQFSGNYNYSLAREVIQNSLDAKQEGSDQPVRVNFNLETFAPSEFPGHDDLTAIFKSCKEYWPKDNDTQVFTKNALSCMGESKIPFLRISDFNTKGLAGDDDDKTGGWYNLVKSTGATSKGEGQGGSFGIGKGAPFAASNLRVVFYSTKTEKAFSKFQGIAELVSHKADNDIKRGVGSFGVKQNSIKNLTDIPERFRRTETGTDIFIAGYKNEAKWQDNLSKSILRNFWYAISKGDLIVKVEKKEINSSNLEKLLTEYFLDENFKDSIKPVGNPLRYYLATMNGKMFEDEMPVLGKVRFYFYQTEEPLNHVAMIRKSHMVIYSRRFIFPGNYAGVFICDDDKGNKELRKMEPPAHDEWIEERNKEKGVKAMAEVVSFVRKYLDQMKATKTSGILDIPELHKYLPFDEDDEAAGKDGVTYTGAESDEETSKQVAKKNELDPTVTINPFKVAVMNTPDSGSGSDGGFTKTGSGKVKGGSSGEGKRKVYRKDQVLSRAFITGKSEETFDYTLIIKSQISDRCNLKLTAVGEEGGEKVVITKATDATGMNYHFTGSSIHRVKLENNKESKLLLTIASTIKYSLKVDVYALQ